MASTQCLPACRHGLGNSLKFKLNIRMEQNGDFCDMVVGARWAGLRTSETANLLGVSGTTFTMV